MSQFLETVYASELRAGDIIYYEGDLMQVETNYLHRNSPYAKLNLVPAENPKHIPLSVKLGLFTNIQRRTYVHTKHLHISNSIEIMSELNVLLEQYDNANELPEKVMLANTNFEVDSVIVQQMVHEKMRACFNRLKNEIEMIKKPS
ncbi:hypothetical protein Fifi44_00013 [Erwinia phage Fifi44]|uniref:Uncharacterized protein n=1 Tax=Erwinia phage Fifi44 TaxID=2876597 RepID=A0AAE8Y378_9CAUD|nr:hypothetical protein QNG95_gp13 [Erwinia phage Fifi44]QQV88317.1 hypothetical protein pEaSNUABM27_00014 [Erwinia phage pEa_SNUABM_27]UCR74882.1 hypothetical protein Fifi44_00013 [Erwinia phage Fifi44]UCR80884.1 putative single-stranded DNA binding protein [Erwinia phage Fifi451]